MNEPINRALLPAGLRDLLPPDAAFEAEVVHSLMGLFAQSGYERVKPPLVEFEDTLLAGSGAGLSAKMFRVMDPISQRMMGVRADMTLQIARIATTRLASEPRPLRLSYAGQVLRTKGTQLRPERQFGQAGIELIGSDAAAADAEVILLVAEGLKRLGVADVSVDLTLPTLVQTISGGQSDELRGALDQKDVSAVSALGGHAAGILESLIDATGPAKRAIGLLKSIPMPPQAQALCAHLEAVVRLVAAAAPDLILTVDPVETRGFEFHTGLGFTVFAKGAAGELGRGGRYVAGTGEPAVGATVFMDTVMGALPGPQPRKRVYLPEGTDRAKADGLRAEGWITVAGLGPVADAKVEAKRLGCCHLLVDGKLVSTGA